jgi:hypothetical protein
MLRSRNSISSPALVLCLRLTCGQLHILWRRYPAKNLEGHVPALALTRTLNGSRAPPSSQVTQVAGARRERRMPGRHSAANDAKRDARAICALFAVFALLFQALIPAAATARTATFDGLAICTSHGAQILPPGGQPAAPHKGGMACQDCLSACMTAVVTPVLAVLPVAYVVKAIEHAPAAVLLAPRARAPPRPLGQGPPTA